MRRGQSTICAFWRSNLSSRSWWQAPLGAEPIHGKVCCYFGSPVARRKTRNSSRDSGPLMLHNCGQTDDPRDCLSWFRRQCGAPRDKRRSLPHLTLIILHSTRTVEEGETWAKLCGSLSPFLPRKPGIHCDGTFPKAALSRVGGGELGSLMRC